MTAPHYKDESVTLYHADCLQLLAELDDCSVDAVVTDPPYGLEFMGREWDAPWQSGAGIGGHTARFSEKRYKDGSTAQIPSYMGGTNPTCRNCGGLRNGRDGKKGQPPCRCDDPRFDNVTLPRMLAYGEWCRLWAAECLRVLKPGGHLLAFGGTRTSHRLACAIEDAGFEVRDCIMWIYGSGFPKSLDVSKAIDRAAGAERQVVGSRLGRRGVSQDGANMGRGFGRAMEGRADRPSPALDLTAPATDDAQRWEGWGTALKPGHEPIVVARRPLAGSVAANVLAHGTGALNIAGSRVGSTGGSTQPSGMDRFNAANARHGYRPGTYEKGEPPAPADAGRWPSNVVFTHSPVCADSCADDCPVVELDRQSGNRPGMGARVLRRGATTGASMGLYNDDGFALPQDAMAGYDDVGGASRFFPVFRYEAKAPSPERPREGETSHPTVKPLDLMRWLVRLVTPPGGLVLEPFAGSGTTAEACVIEGMRCVAVEREAAYLPLIVQRLGKPLQPVLL